MKVWGKEKVRFMHSAAFGIWMAFCMAYQTGQNLLENRVSIVMTGKIVKTSVMVVVRDWH